MTDKTGRKTAFIYSAVPPSPWQKERFLRFIAEKYGDNYELLWKDDSSLENGFRLEVDFDVYDWSGQGRLRQLRDALSQLDVTQKGIIPLIKEKVGSWGPQALAEEIGTVLVVGDGIAAVEGLDKATYGEILLFDCGARGMVLNIDTDEIGCIIFDDDDEITEGSHVRRTGKTAGIAVGSQMLGRVVNALGAPIDGAGNIETEKYLPIENPAPGILERRPVHVPLQTGILAIDAMFPIGRGQRELIIGDRQTGKTSIAIDTIVNQKNKDVICIYVAIGQKISSVVNVAENLKKRGAMDYTVIVSASASDSAPMQYIAPYAGTSIGEFFMKKGRDVLIVYDDLSKHAIAYRALSLLLGRSPGREAYPGDVFYLHSRLLERSACLDEEYGGSMTALPIVETQAGDVSAYIPTNIISITDGQIFLESELFFSGQRPAVNVGISVSRVGGDAQTKAMKKSAGTIRLDLAQYREMEVFTQFSSDLDEATQKQLKYGQGLMYMLRQPQYSPMEQYEQVITLTAALAHCMQDIPAKKVRDYIKSLLSEFKAKHEDICQTIESSGFLSDENKHDIIEFAKKKAEIFI